MRGGVEGGLEELVYCDVRGSKSQGNVTIKIWWGGIVVTTGGLTSM